MPYDRQFLQIFLLGNKLRTIMTRFLCRECRTFLLEEGKATKGKGGSVKEVLQGWELVSFLLSLLHCLVQ